MALLVHVAASVCTEFHLCPMVAELGGHDEIYNLDRPSVRQNLEPTSL